MGVYDRQRATAERLIREKGKPVQLKRVTMAQDPATPWIPEAPVETIENTQGVFLNFNQKDLETQSKTPGLSEVAATDRKVLLAAQTLSARPTLNDQIIDEDGVWSIEWVQELSPNGEDILYTVRARR